MPIKHVKRVVRNLPEKKPYFEVIGAVLTIPVLITVFLLNINNLTQNKTTKNTPTPTLMQEVVVHNIPGKEIIVTATPNLTLSPTQSPSCQKTVGDVNIFYPQEGQTVTENPVCFIIKHDDVHYCSVVWSYRINNSPYSEYSSNSPCIYNMPSGPAEFDLRVQSTVSNDQSIFVRKFIYQGNTGVTPAPSPSQ